MRITYSDTTCDVLLCQERNVPPVESRGLVYCRDDLEERGWYLQQVNADYLRHSVRLSDTVPS